MGFFMGKFQGLRIRGKSVMRVKMQGSKTDPPIFTLKFSLFFLSISNLIKNGYIYRSKYSFQNDLVAYHATRFLYLASVTGRGTRNAGLAPAFPIGLITYRFKTLTVTGPSPLATGGHWHKWRG